MALDVCTPANQAILRIQCQIEHRFRQFLFSERFLWNPYTKILESKIAVGLERVCGLYNMHKTWLFPREHQRFTP